jgi:histidinol-phosphate/aromatic aminotransferase/cobyric acid decarboxylase-like protein
VIVDESNANYYPPAFSAANLVGEVNNIAVLRGFSKAFGLGGLRLACCIASHDVASQVRSTIPPLLPSSLSLRIGRRVLELGDITGTLRERIRIHKEKMLTLFSNAGISPARPAAGHLPYLLLENNPLLINRLEQSGIRGKLHTVWSGGSAGLHQVYRLSVPLRTERMQALEKALGAA